MHYSKKHLFPLALLLMLNGCINSTYKATEEVPQVPSNWEHDHQTKEVDPNWVVNFTSLSDNTHVMALINDAIENSQSLKQQAFNVAIAEQSLTVAQSNFWPSLSLDFDASRAKSSSNIISNEFGVSSALSYELDVWGALSDTQQQAKLAYLAAQADYEESRLQLMGDVIIAYANASRAFQRVQLSQQQMTNSRQNLDIIENGYKSGLNESLDVYLARNEFNNDSANLAANQQALNETTRALNRVLGLYPSANIDVSRILRLPTSDVGTGVPAQMVTRKPALQSQWLSLLSQNAALAIAHKARFPEFTLRANLGTSNDSLSGLSASDMAWSLLGNISAPIFNAGRLQANEEIERLTLKSLEQTYLEAVFDALLEVENAISNEAALLLQGEVTQTAQHNASIAQELAFEQYIAGLVSYTTVLDAQDRLIAAQTNLIDIQTNLITNRIQLHVALGEGAQLNTFVKER